MSAPKSPDVENKSDQGRGVADLGFARIDLDRAGRTGVPEAIYGEGKTPDQIEAIARTLLCAGQNVVVTRVASETANALVAAFDDEQFQTPAGARTARANANATGRVVTIEVQPPPRRGRVAIVCAGTTDRPVAEEARVCAAAWGADVDAIDDIGVAGLQRVLAVQDRLNAAQAVVVVAGMDGALPSVVAGLVKTPVIAVPTSVGYGAAFEGLAPLLSMLNACAEGVVVVNIDNGFGAARAAMRFLLRSEAENARD